MAEVYFDFHIGDIEFGMYKNIKNPFMRHAYFDGSIYILFWKFFIIKEGKQYEK